MEKKVTCDFCGRTNAKWEDIYEGGGLFSSAKKVGRKEVIEKTHKFYRCPNCGRFYCENCKKKKFSLGSVIKLPFSILTFGAVDVLKVVCLKCGKSLRKI